MRKWRANSYPPTRQTVSLDPVRTRDTSDGQWSIPTPHLGTVALTLLWTGHSNGRTVPAQSVTTPPHLSEVKDSPVDSTDHLG